MDYSQLDQLHQGVKVGLQSLAMAFGLTSPKDEDYVKFEGTGAGEGACASLRRGGRRRHSVTQCLGALEVRVSVFVDAVRRALPWSGSGDSFLIVLGRIVRENRPRTHIAGESSVDHLLKDSAGFRQE